MNVVITDNGHILRNSVSFGSKSVDGTKGGKVGEGKDGRGGHLLDGGTLVCPEGYGVLCVPTSAVGNDDMDVLRGNTQFLQFGVKTVVTFNTDLLSTSGGNVEETAMAMVIQRLSDQLSAHEVIAANGVAGIFRIAAEGKNIRDLGFFDFF